MNIQDLKNKHYGKDAFCIGTAPHLKDLDLMQVRDKVTIACNQLIHDADKYDINYLCLKSDKRFEQFKESMSANKKVTYIIPNNVLKQYPRLDGELLDRIISVNLQFTSPEHTNYFSFDLNECVYAEDTLSLQVQLAVWMGCKTIYTIGVDGDITDLSNPYFDQSLNPTQDELETIEHYSMPDMNEWLGKAKHLLWTKGIQLFNGAGTFSSLTALPKVRFQAATGKPTVAVTSKTFSQDEYLVDELKRYFINVKINDSKDKLKGDALVNFLKDSDGIILGTEPLSAGVMSKLPCLRYVSKYGVGLNNVDFQAAKKNEIKVVYKKGVNSDSVAELTMAFALMLIRRMYSSIQGYKNNKWSKLPGKELSEMTLGVIGYGHVGKVVARKFAVLGVGRILVNDLSDVESAPPIESVPLDYLLGESDIVSLHISGESCNHHFVDDLFLNKMKSGSYLINTARGEIVNECSLVEALRQGRLAGAGLDVYEHEPDINSDLSLFDNVLTTCHIAGSSNRAIKNMGWAAIEGLVKLFNIEQ